MSESSQLNLYPLPYTASQPPSSLRHGVQTESGHSDTAAFDTGLDNRDIFLGERRCVVCGYQDIVDHCHIIRSSDNYVVRPSAIEFACMTIYSFLIFFLVEVSQEVGMGPKGCQRVTET